MVAELNPQQHTDRAATMRMVEPRLGDGPVMGLPASARTKTGCYPDQMLKPIIFEH